MQRLERDTTNNSVWEAEPTKNRIFKSIAIPITAAVVIFTVCVGVAVAVVMFRPSNQLGADAVDEKIFAKEANIIIDDTLHSQDEDPTKESSVIFIHVTGEILNSGVYELKAGARVHDAIEAAGGHTEEAALETVNLARVLMDGEQITVPNIKSINTAIEGIHIEAGESASYESSVSINTADAATLETLPRIGPALAGRIIDWRESNGGFQKLEDLMHVSGIGSKVFENLKDKITL